MSIHNIPQTNRKLERYQQIVKREVNQIPYELPGQLERAIALLPQIYLLPFSLKASSHQTVNPGKGVPRRVAVPLVFREGSDHFAQLRISKARNHEKCHIYAGGNA